MTHYQNIKIVRDRGNNICAIKLTLGSRTVTRKFMDSRLADLYLIRAHSLTNDVLDGNLSADEARAAF